MKFKYYKKRLHKSIKEKYFKYFKDMINDDENFLRGNIYTVKFTPDNKHIAVYNEFIREIDDYISIDNLIIPQSKELLHLQMQTENVEYMFKSVYEEDFETIEKETVSILCELSDESYLVGGAIRSIMRGENFHDLDFVTDSNYDLLATVFKSHKYKVMEVGKQFKVLKVSKSGYEFDIVNFRKDGTYTDGRHPDTVSVGTIEDDAHRRDFTINALYLKLDTLEIVDPTGLGIQDSLDKVLRFVGKPDNRIKEDALRVYRFYRFLSNGLKPDKASLTSCRKNFKCATETISSTRIMYEIEKMCQELK